MSSDMFGVFAPECIYKSIEGFATRFNHWRCLDVDDVRHMIHENTHLDCMSIF